MKSMIHNKFLFFLGAIISFSVLSGAYFIEYVLKVPPCPLCVLQRFALWGISIFFLIGALHQRSAIFRSFYIAVIIIFSLLGMSLAARHVWLIQNANSLPSSCLAGFENMLAFRSLWEVLKDVLANQECSQIDFTLLKITLPTWSLIIFVLLTLYSLILGWIQIKRRI